MLQLLLPARADIHIHMADAMVGSRLHGA